MKAAVRTSFGQPPRYSDDADSAPGLPEVPVDVLAAGPDHVTRRQTVCATVREAP